MADDRREIGDYLAYHGGPFFELQQRLGLLHKDALSATKRAAFFIGLAWGVPLIISIFEGHAFGSFAERPFLLDTGVWARFFVAVGAFILAERQIERELRGALSQFVRAPVLSPSSYVEGAQAVSTALRRRDLKRAEAICLVVAYLLSLVSLYAVRQGGDIPWALSGDSSSGSLTVTGWWCLLVSSPIFLFLFLRCLWREFVWALLLRHLARLDLRLVVSHPDGKGGIAFIGRYPNAYAVFIFGASCVVGAAIAHELMNETLAVKTYGYLMAAWLAIVLALFAFPLSAFTAPLLRLKAATLLLAGAQSTRFHRQSERKLLGTNVVANDPDEAASQVDAADASKHFDTAKKMSVILMSRAALVPVAAAALLPLFAAGATELPYKELWSIVKKLLLL